MAQKLQRRSQPEAIFSGATGPLCSRWRIQPAPRRRVPAGRACPGSDRPRPSGRVDRRDGSSGAAVDRGVRRRPVPVQHLAQERGQIRVRVEAEDRVGLRQRLRRVPAVPLGQAPDRDHLRAGVGGGQHRVDGVLLGARPRTRRCSPPPRRAPRRHRVVRAGLVAADLSRPAISDESTSLRAQPRVSSCTRSRMRAGRAAAVRRIGWPARRGRRHRGHRPTLVAGTASETLSGARSRALPNRPADRARRRWLGCCAP